MLSKRRDQPIIVFSAVATPFSRCRALCRFILRAGHSSLKAKRFRRLRGGLFGWQHRGGSVAMPIGYGDWHKGQDGEDGRFKGMQKVKIADAVDAD